jgi:ADP-ribose pyrophosphatase
MSQPTKTVLHSSKFLALIKEGHWEYVDRVNATGAALIVAVTPDEKVLLVEQYRIPVHARTIELPAGIIGDEPDSTNETIAEAARRELLEETGYTAERIEAVTHEDITVHEIPLVEVVTWLEAKGKTGVLIDPKVYAGLFFITQNK